MILSLDTQRDIRNAALSALHYIAFEMHCDVPDIIALITPSQPDPKQVAPSAATAPGADTGGEEPSILPANPSEAPGITTSDPLRSEVATREDARSDASETPSPEPQPTSTPAVQAQNVEPTSEVLDGPSHSLPGAERAADPVPRPDSVVDDVEEEERSVKVEADKSVAAPAAAAPAPRRELLKDRLIALNAAELTLTRKGLAERLGVGVSYVNTAVNRHFLTVPNEPRPPAAPKPEPVAKAPTLADRIRAHLVGHPDATMRELSDALGSKQSGIGWAAKKAGITIRKYTAKERSAATAKGIQAKIADKTPKRPVEGADMARPGKVALDTENEPLDAPRVVKRPKGQRIRLRQKLGAGKYLHMGGEGLVDSKVYAWIGTPAQLEALRAKFPDTVGMVEEVVEA